MADVTCRTCRTTSTPLRASPLPKQTRPVFWVGALALAVGLPVMLQEMTARHGAPVNPLGLSWLTAVVIPLQIWLYRFFFVDTCAACGSTDVFPAEATAPPNSA